MVIRDPVGVVQIRNNLRHTKSIYRTKVYNLSHNRVAINPKKPYRGLDVCTMRLSTSILRDLFQSLNNIRVYKKSTKCVTTNFFLRGGTSSYIQLRRTPQHDTKTTKKRSSSHTLPRRERRDMIPVDGTDGG